MHEPESVSSAFRLEGESVASVRVGYHYEGGAYVSVCKSSFQIKA
jgi:hypothetical protein